MLEVHGLKYLRGFEIAAYLAPTMLVMRNCDDIFDQQTNQIRFLELDSDISIFVCKPSLLIWQVVVGFIKNNHSSKFTLPFKQWLLKQEPFPLYLEKCLGSEISNGKLKLACFKQLPLINLKDSPGITDWYELQDKNFIEKHVKNHWRNLFQKYVSSLLSKSVKPKAALESCFQKKYVKEPIAVVGMSCRYPSSNSVDEFWNLLFEAKDGTSNPPKHRWERNDSPRVIPESTKTNAGFLNIPVDEFDAKFFGKILLLVDILERHFQ